MQMDGKATSFWWGDLRAINGVDVLVFVWEVPGRFTWENVENFTQPQSTTSAAEEKQKSVLLPIPGQHEEKHLSSSQRQWQDLEMPWQTFTSALCSFRRTLKLPINLRPCLCGWWQHGRHFGYYRFSQTVCSMFKVHWTLRQQQFSIAPRWQEGKAAWMNSPVSKVLLPEISSLWARWEFCVLGRLFAVAAHPWAGLGLSPQDPWVTAGRAAWWHLKWVSHFKAW